MGNGNWQPSGFGNFNQLIAKRYRLGHSLGKGGFGQVFLAKDIKYDPPRQVALKLLHPQFLNEPGVMEDIRREASALAQLKHPNILRVIDFEVEPDIAYIITDYAEGGSLATKLRPNSNNPPIRLPLEQVAWYLEQLAKALDYAHSQGLVHRDIKPLNILLDQEGRPLIADFGLATALSHSQSSHLVTTDPSGTPAYMAPEQWMGQAGKPTDIYALAVVIYQMITGQLPFKGQQFELMGQHLNAPIPTLAAYAPDLKYPAGLDIVMAGALAKDPKQRTKPTSEFYRQFSQALSAGQVVVTPISNPQSNQIHLAALPTQSQIPTRVNQPANLVTSTPSQLPSQPSPANLPQTEIVQGLGGGVNNNTLPPTVGVVPQPKSKRKLNPILVGGFLAALLVAVGIGVAVWIPRIVDPVTATPTATSTTQASLVGSPTSNPGPTVTSTTQVSPVGSPTFNPSPTATSTSQGTFTFTATSKPQISVKELSILSGHTNWIWNVGWSPDGKILASASADRTIRLWDATGKPITTLSGHTDEVSSLAWSPDGKTLASASIDGTVRLWDATGKPITTLSGHTFGAYRVAWSPDGKTLASASRDSTVRLWDATGKPITTLSSPSERINTLTTIAWSPDSKILASGDKTIRLWDATGKPIATFPGYTEDGGISLTWSPDSKILASTSIIDKTVRLWDATGKPIATLSGYTARISNIAWSPDGKILASASADGTIRLWDAVGKPITTLFGHTDGVEAVAWSPDGKTLASASGDHTVRLWSVTT